MYYIATIAFLFLLIVNLCSHNQSRLEINTTSNFSQPQNLLSIPVAPRIFLLCTTGSQSSLKPHALHLCTTLRSRLRAKACLSPSYQSDFWVNPRFAAHDKNKCYVRAVQSEGPGQKWAPVVVESGATRSHLL